MAIDPGQTDPAQELARRPGVVRTTEPAFGLPAYWLSSGDRPLAERLGYTVVDQATVVITLLQERVAGVLPVFVDRTMVEQALSSLRAHAPALHAELMRLEQARWLSRAQICELLRQLVREQVPIRDCRAIFETLVMGVHEGLCSAGLLRAVRQRLHRNICAALSEMTGKLELIELHPSVLSGFKPETGRGLDGDAATRLEDELMQAARGCEDLPVLLTSPDVRAAVAAWVAERGLGLAVLSNEELDQSLPSLRVAVVGESLSGASSH